MKIQTAILTIIAASAFCLTGCNKSSENAAGDGSTPAISVDTSKMEAAFDSADEATKKALEPAITAIKNADYAGAVSHLKSLGEKFKLTDAQKAEVDDLIAKVQQAIKDMSAKAAGDASKAVGDATKALGK